MRTEAVESRELVPVRRPLVHEQPRFSKPQPDYIDAEFEVMKSDAEKLAGVRHALATIERESVVEPIVVMVEKKDEVSDWELIKSLLATSDEFGRRFYELMVKNL